MVTGEIILEARNLTKAFGKIAAVQDLSISFPKGQLHSILGPNGAGKTTLFNLLTRDYSVTSGDIYLKGDRVTGLKPYQIAQRGVGRSYQISSVYLDLSFLQNVWLAAYGAEKRGRAGFWKPVSSYHEVMRKSKELLVDLGLEPYLHTQAKSVSYGDQRLLEIAVTLATGPEVLLLDEPTAGLSARETIRVKEFIESIKSRYTIVMIEHKMNVVMEISDFVHVMNFGHLIASGTPTEISQNADVHKAYFGMEE